MDTKSIDMPHVAFPGYTTWGCNTTSVSSISRQGFLDHNSYSDEFFPESGSISAVDCDSSSLWEVSSNKFVWPSIPWI